MVLALLSHVAPELVAVDPGVEGGRRALDNPGNGGLADPFLQIWLVDSFLQMRVEESKS